MLEWLVREGDAFHEPCFRDAALVSFEFPGTGFSAETGKRTFAGHVFTDLIRGGMSMDQAVHVCFSTPAKWLDRSADGAVLPECRTPLTRWNPRLSAVEGIE